MPEYRADAITTEANSGLASLLTRTDATPDAPLGDAYHGRSATDVLAHLHAWHVLLNSWVTTHRAGGMPVVPAPGCTWAQLDEFNTTLYEEFQGRPYVDVRNLLVTSHADAVHMVATFSDDELVAADAFAWLGGQSLGFVAHECLAGHYAWAEGVLDAAGVAA